MVAGMSISTSIQFLDGGHPDYIKALNGTREERKAWEEDNGSTDDRPGAVIEDTEDAYYETSDEYGGWIIPIATLPAGTTHIVISRG